MGILLESGAGGAGNAGGGSGWLGIVLYLVVIVVFFYFILIRPQKKKEKELKNMIAALKVGDEVATVGGIHGKIVKVKDELFVIESGAGNNKSTITVDRGSVARYLKRGSEKDVELIEEAPENTEE